jgi:hypothetical protein
MSCEHLSEPIVFTHTFDRCGDFLFLLLLGLSAEFLLCCISIVDSFQPEVRLFVSVLVRAARMLLHLIWMIYFFFVFKVLLCNQVKMPGAANVEREHVRMLRQTCIRSTTNPKMTTSQPSAK